MKKIIQVISISALLLACVGYPAMGEEQENLEGMYHYLAGHYILIGKEMNSDKTYQGMAAFVYENGRLNVTRKIHGLVVKGEGRIEHALGPDEVDVLRVRFVQAGLNYEVTYVWQSDLDNYPRLSGYLYQPGKQTESPGLEALFRDHTQK